MTRKLNFVAQKCFMKYNISSDLPKAGGAVKSSRPNYFTQRNQGQRGVIEFFPLLFSPLHNTVSF